VSLSQTMIFRSVLDLEPTCRLDYFKIGFSANNPRTTKNHSNLRPLKVEIILDLDNSSAERGPYIQDISATILNQ